MRLKPVVFAVVGLSMALSACGGAAPGGGGDKPEKPDEPQQSASSPGLPDADKHIAPAAIVVPIIPGLLPEPLKKPRDSDFYGDLQGTKGTMKCTEAARCEGVVSGAINEYGTEMFDDGGEYARFEVWEYRTSISARGAYDAWEKEISGKAKGFYALPKGRYGDQYSASTPVAGEKKMGERMLLARQGKYVGLITTFTRADIAEGSKPGPTALLELGKMQAERMRQADQGNAPSASAAHVQLPG
ncbi:hypothetical protein [Streptomyces boluensis]|uniref:Lipoprotein n=1 Tax=Streptomyces boluensis TaxID=1775135 RepID=A0A964UT01_9ACTN|nr:hypothetical protein [Streptomyces boluensis]NBE54869.1 hypothetical protein [Streptomyces boluensis]